MGTIGQVPMPSMHFKANKYQADNLYLRKQIDIKRDLLGTIYLSTYLYHLKDTKTGYLGVTGFF
jgi:hypothetical protein